MKDGREFEVMLAHKPIYGQVRPVPAENLRLELKQAGLVSATLEP
jgi:hypothetical protein